MTHLAALVAVLGSTTFAQDPGGVLGPAPGVIDDGLPPLLGTSLPDVAGVVNGTDAVPGEFPNVVVLVFVAYGAPFCSATVIDPLWVLTAGHCVAGLEGAFLGGDIAVVADANLFSPDDPPALSAVFAAEGIVHPDYSGTANGSHDVALVRLANPLTGIDPAVLNDEPLAASWVGEEITFVGYGVTSDTQIGGGLRRYADIPVVAVDALVVYALDDGDPHQNVCNGDSGGAAFENTAAGVELAGVNSFVFALYAGDLPCNDGGTGAARVDIHVPWIQGFVPDVLLEPPGGDPDTGLPADDPPADTGVEGLATIATPTWGEPKRPSADQYPKVLGCAVVGPSSGFAGTAPLLLVGLVLLTRRARPPYAAASPSEA